MWEKFRVSRNSQRRNTYGRLIAELPCITYKQGKWLGDFVDLLTLLVKPFPVILFLNIMTPYKIVRRVFQGKKEVRRRVEPKTSGSTLDHSDQLSRELDATELSLT